MGKKARTRRVLPKRVLNIYEVIGKGKQTPVALSAGLARDPVILSIEGTPDYRREVPGFASFFKERAQNPNIFHIYHKVGDALSEVELPPTDLNFTRIQPMPNGCWLLVVGRTRSKTEKNARVFDASGNFISSFYVGDGIEDVQVNDQGNNIWISYFDEGVYSGHTISQSGFNCFDRNGAVLFSFSEAAGEQSLAQ